MQWYATIVFVCNVAYNRGMRTLAYEKVYEMIKQKIIQGVWKQGDQIPPVPQLAKDTQVGVSSVREAIRVLGKQGILKMEQGRGTYVMSGDFDLADTHSRIDFLEKATLKQLTEARVILEPELAALAAEHASDDEIVAIKQAAETMFKKVKQNERFFEDDMRFHHKIAQSSQNQILYQMIDTMADLLVESRRRTMKFKDMSKKAAHYHILIAEAIAQRNPTQSRSLMKAHMLDVLTDLDKIDS